MTGEWLDIGWIDEIPLRGSRVVQVDGGDDIALFRTGDGQVFALRDRCPHQHGRLSQGIVHGATVTCPLHNWRIALASGEAQGEDRGCTPTVPVKLSGGRVLLCRASTLRAAA
ncbi:nitrite reductase small subunit NirD [Sphingomonas citri]|jgi:nitrite reductase (NADH) small subunit|uniref:Nitrite reductase small subunit NirD n=1 Tax=Sphingomonas citri TaxID=2862499 RepID=A0ABS7BM48_9SPHN|nr:nitrite reductase small subunit NirD [Sphingomonas citri]MBW6530603.1 nitrite reductase small subunit NirD [Sphingomonas citri]